MIRENTEFGSIAKAKIMLVYPPGKLYQRGEDRCQASVENSTASAVRACNDLGYCAAVLESRGYDVFLMDYPTEGKSFSDVESDIRDFCPDLIMISVTNATIFEDIEFTRRIRKIRNMKIVLKGAIFFNPENEMLSLLELDCVDFLIGGEAETCIGGIADYALRQEGDISAVDNILYKDAQGRFCPTRFHCWVTDLDSISFPARTHMTNCMFVQTRKSQWQLFKPHEAVPQDVYTAYLPLFQGKKYDFGRRKM